MNVHIRFACGGPLWRGPGLICAPGHGTPRIVRKLERRAQNAHLRRHMRTLRFTLARADWWRGGYEAD